MNGHKNKSEVHLKVSFLNLISVIVNPYLPLTIKNDLALMICNHPPNYSGEAICDRASCKSYRWRS